MTWDIIMVLILAYVAYARSHLKMTLPEMNRALWQEQGKFTVPQPEAWEEANGMQFFRFSMRSHYLRGTYVREINMRTSIKLETVDFTEVTTKARLVVTLRGGEFESMEFFPCLFCFWEWYTEKDVDRGENQIIMGHIVYRIVDIAHQAEKRRSWEVRQG